LSDVQEGIVPQTIWEHEEVGNTQEAKKEIVKLIPDGIDVFSTPKPTRLLQRILRLATNPGDLVMDSFAGSGTTGHAVLQANKEDGGNRRFILVEMDENISKNITAERLRRVAQGYTYKDQKGNKKKEAGLGGGFRYCELGATLFDTDGQIREEVKYNDLAQHVYFIETGLPLTPSPSPKGRGGRSSFPLLGIHNDTAVYLLYNGILRDKKPNGGNVLTRKMLASLPKHDGAKIIYGTGCLKALNSLEIRRVLPFECLFHFRIILHQTPRPHRLPRKSFRKPPTALRLSA
jgi:site-specific DNA-methyltransferase (adenine-specific)/adenine-specific DNA-methyltransferase